MEKISVLWPNFANLWFWVKVINSNQYINNDEHVRLVLSAKFYKNQTHCNFETKSVQVFNFGPALMAKCYSIWKYIGIESSWNEGIDTCFNVECVLLGRKFDFLGGYLVITVRYLVVTPRYCSLLCGYSWLLLVTARYCSLPLLVWTLANTACE